MLRKLFILPFLAIFLNSCDSKKSTTESGGHVSPYTEIPEAEFVGVKSCKTCHEQEFGEWMQSDHHKAMLPATDETVLGDFTDVTFEHFGRETKFYRKGDEFWVNAENEAGERVDYKIDYTFGHYPLQQYLIPFPGGRYQALQVCWDSRPKEEGGQRWYHLYPDEEIPPDDILHWSKRHFNWNYMCADCHSTNLKKNFDSEKNEYHTSWSEINVSCEACHGPGSVHVNWAKLEAGEEVPNLDEVKKYMQSKGLVVRLKEPEPGAWVVNPETGQPERTVALKSDVQVDTCARCHSHRQLMEPNYKAGASFHDTHSPSILTDQLYHHDGQVDEEVYVYGSFVQSKMYHAGVRCTDCHHPHTMKTLAQGNALCVRCHVPQKYDTPAHHFHQVGSTGAQCVECHMPTKNYMVVDARRDHSLRIPRPDLAKKLGTPDACTNCHQDKDVDWATEAFFERWGRGPRNSHYGEIIAEARQGNPGSLDRLIALAGDLDRPGIVRATAVEQLGFAAGDPDAFKALTERLSDEDPNVRKTAVAALLPFPTSQRAIWAAPLLKDPVRSVRTEAVRVLAAAKNDLTESQKADFDKAAEEYISRQQAVSDRAAGHMGLGLFYTDTGEMEKALDAYRDAARIEPEFVPARINLAELLFQLNRPKEAEKEFRAAVEAAAIPENEGQARDALARFLIRMKRHEEGIAELAKATKLMPNHAQTQYFYAVALNSTGKTEQALTYLERATELDPNNPEYLMGAAAICRDAGKAAQALSYAQRALDLQPGNQQLQQLVRSLGGRL
ncbi:MAG: tetratricopeptide repeat protein [Verrucomicrobiales bacterium]|nr:tetratricopeptide repeat protein [Verrucomicrobiales bacterium]